MYSLTVQHIDFENQQITTYGIAWSGENPISVQDVSLCEAKVRALVARLNELALDPAHLSDVIDDFLSAQPDF